MANIELYDVYLNGDEVITGADSVTYTEFYGKGEARTAHGGGQIITYFVSKLDDQRQTIKFKVPVGIGSVNNARKFREALAKEAIGNHTIKLKPRMEDRDTLTFRNCGTTDHGEVNVSDDNSTEFTFEGIQVI